MKILGIDHIGIAVSSIEKGSELWESTLSIPCSGLETVHDQKVTTAFFPLENTEIELLEATDDASPISQFLAKRGEGIHHIAFRVDNLIAAIAELKEKGIRLIDEKPRVGAGNARIAFLHPKMTNGVLIELCERGEHEE